MASFADLQKGSIPSSPSSPSSSPSKGTSSSLPVSSLFTPRTTNLLSLDDPIPPYSISLIYGLNGSGKTEFAVGHVDPLTGTISGGIPGPLAVFDFDNRGYQACKSANAAGKKIHYFPSALAADIGSMEEKDAKEYATASLSVIKADYSLCLQMARKREIRGIVLDGVKELGDLIKIMVRGRPDRPKPKKGEFLAGLDAVINQELWYFTNAARESRVTLMMIARAKPNSWPEPTGFIWDCDKVWDAAADWSAQIAISSVEDKVKEVTEAAGGKPTALQLMQAMNSKPSLSLVLSKPLMLNGVKYTEKEWGEDGPYPYACSKLIPRTKVEDWR